MIQVDFRWAVGLVITALLSGVAFFWLRQPARGRREASSLDPRFVWVCAVCTYNYVNTREEKISKCPRCGSFNKR